MRARRGGVTPPLRHLITKGECTTATLRQTDVLIAGYGLAGAVAACAAHDAGASVLLLEKGQYPGGCSALSGGGIKCVRDPQEATAYLRELCGRRTPDSLIESFARGLAENEAFVRQMAQRVGARVQVVPRMHGRPPGVYPFPGRDTWYEVRIVQVPGFSRFPHIREMTRHGINMFRMAMMNVEARGIEVWSQATARRLVREGDAVVGAVVAREGQETRVAARRAVVLATGGFEHSPWLRAQYLQGQPFYSMAPLTHTGDGILMAQQAGAALWHMGFIKGSYGFKLPGYPVAFMTPFAAYRSPGRRMPWIVVDRRGRRYMNEYHPAPANTNHWPMETFDPDLPGYPRIPSYITFDEAGRRLGPIGKPINFDPYFYDWSTDNSQEIEKGWILRADSLDGLAAATLALPENGGLLDSATLRETVAAWNKQVEVAHDPLGRPPGTMMPLSTPPFYAATVWPIVINTEGGPVHDERQQVLDPFGQAIPRLYAVGELGSFFGHLYELGGNLAECFISGRVAGRYAAAEPPVDMEGALAPVT
ncbi:MAG: FAD-binding protein [Chloroflexi bacterium]|nr:FAD-binding protein [Chloroflexota bacterium]